MFRKLAVLLIMVSLGTAGTQGASVLFPARADTDAGSTAGASHLATVDVDGDGITDVVVVSLSVGAVDLVDPDSQVGLQVFDSDGRGLFLPPTTILVPLNSFPGAIVSGDFDRDGDSDDIAVAVEDTTGSTDVGDPGEVMTGGVLVYLRTAGLYALDVALSGELAEPGFTGLAVGTFGGSAADDLVMVNSASNSFSVFINSATGTGSSFATTLVTSGAGVCSSPVGVGSGQLDATTGDDLAIICDPPTGTDIVQTWENAGAGTFSLFAVQPTATLDAPSAVVVADLNNDTRDDIAIANSFLPAGGPGNLTLLRNTDGLGGFIEFTTTNVPVGSSPVSLDVGDPNGDGILDLLAANLDDEDISVLTGALLGTGPTAQPLYTESAFSGGLNVFPWETRFANLDGAGAGDVVSAHSNLFTTALASYLGDSTSVLSAAPIFRPTDASGFSQFFFATAIATGDFDGDTIPDFAVANSGDDTVAVFGATPGGATPFQLLDILPLTPGDFPDDLLAEDVNNDGFVDVVVLLAPGFVPGDVATFLNNGSGGFAAAPNFRNSVGNQPFAMARARLDGDTIPDLAISNLGDNTVTLLKGLSNGGYDPVVIDEFDVTGGSACAPGNEENTCTPTGLALADINGDGDIDMVVSLAGNIATGGSLRVFNNNGTGTMSAGQLLTSPDPLADPNNPLPDTVSHGAVFFADLDGANGPDIIAIGDLPDDLVSVFLNDGVGAFPSVASPFLIRAVDTPPFLARSAVVTDMNGDGVPDLAVVGNESNNVALMLGAGDGTFFSARADAFGTVAGPVAVAAGDVNNDGLVDLVVVGEVDDDVAVLDSGLDDRTDVNASSRADGVDLAILSRLFGIDATDPGYDFYFDINGDGKMDGLDITVLSLFFGVSFF